MKIKLFDKIIFSICLVVFSAVSTYAEPPAGSVTTATDQLLYEASRREVISTSLNSSATWDTTATIDAAWAERLTLKDFLADGYFLRAIVLFTSNDVDIHLYGDGINCKYADADTTTGYLRAGKSITLEFDTVVDSINVIADNANTIVDAWIIAARPKLVSP